MRTMFEAVTIFEVFIELTLGVADGNKANKLWIWSLFRLKIKERLQRWNHTQVEDQQFATLCTEFLDSMLQKACFNSVICSIETSA